MVFGFGDPPRRARPLLSAQFHTPSDGGSAPTVSCNRAARAPRTTNLSIIYAAAWLLTTFPLTPAAVGQHDTSAYASYVEDLRETRDHIRQTYLAAGSRKDRDSIVSASHAFLLGQLCDSLFPYWFGAPWNFYGQTRTPGRGAIACGYFVTNTLHDAGFEIPRVKWAMSASEYFIKILSSDIKRFSKAPISQVREYIAGRGDGLYIVGLDCHVGFIYKLNGRIRFVHANYYQPEIGVMAEELEGTNPLNDSKYRVVGQILDRIMVRNWILKPKY